MIKTFIFDHLFLILQEEKGDDDDEDGAGKNSVKIMKEKSVYILKYLLSEHHVLHGQIERRLRFFVFVLLYITSSFSLLLFLFLPSSRLFIEAPSFLGSSMIF